MLSLKGSLGHIPAILKGLYGDTVDGQRTLDYGNYGIFLIMGNARFCPSTVRLDIVRSNSCMMP